MTLKMNLQRGLVGHWTMNDSDTSNGTLYDRSPYDNHGTLSGNISTGVDSPVGQAYDFDGGDDSVEGDLTDVSSQYSIVCWVKVDVSLTTSDMSDWAEVVSINDCSIRDRPDADKFECYAKYSGQGQTYESLPYSNDGWHHAVHTFDGRYKKGYWDSSSIFTLDTGGDTLKNTTDTYNIGHSEYPRPISGVRIYNRALSEDEINQLYQIRNQRNAYL